MSPGRVSPRVDQPVDLPAHPVGFGVLGVGDVADDLLARPGVAPQPLGLAGGVPVDHRVGRVEDGLGGAVVLLQQDGAGVGEVPLELQDVADSRAPERVDRLVGVADHAQLGRGEPLGAGDQLLDQGVLRVVGVLVLVDQDVPESAAVALRDVRMRLEQVHRRHDQVVEVQRVRLPQPPLVERVRLGQRPLVGARGPAGELLRVGQLVLQVGHLGGQPPGRVALRVEIQFPGDQLHQPAGVVGVVDGEGRLQAGVLVLGAQNAHAGGVERRHPHQPGARTDQVGHPLLHLPGGLVGKSDRDDLAGVDVPRGEQVGDPVGEHPGLAGAGPGHDQQR
ncbi:hypothetical protein TPA0907_02630 [Micromonospora humidisoli]|nr:hypothetical protein TPA0907_02630 [Micromonospora sp. AKA109]